MAIADIDKPRPKINVAEIGVWGIAWIGAAALAVAALTGQLPAWSTRFLDEWRTGLLAMAGFAIVLVGQVFFNQYFELRRARMSLLAGLDEQQARADELIEILENEELEKAKPLPRARSRSPKRPRPTRITVSGD